jgi:hypothetical protein
MSSQAQESAALVAHPVGSTSTTGLKGVVRILLTGSAQNTAIPADLRGKWLNVTVNSLDDVQYLFSTTGAAITVVLNQVAALGTGHAQAGKTVFSKTSVDRRVPSNASHLCFISSGANAGWLELECSEAPAQG